MIKKSVAYLYAKWGSRKNNKQVPKYVKLQEKEWIKIADGKVKGVWVSEEKYKKVMGILDLIIHPDLHRPMSEALEPYAMLFITAVFCTLETDEEGIDKRYYETAVLEIARKNYKTFTSAVMFVVMMLTEPKHSRLFSVAPDKDIASEIKLAISKIIEESPELFNEYNQEFELLRSEVRCKRTKSTYTPLAYGRDRLDSRTANVFLADEVGAMDNYPIEAMRSSQINLRERLGILISTQYPTDKSALEDEIDMAKRRLEGLNDFRVFSLLYEPDDELKIDDKWMTDDNCIYQANPVAIDHKKLLNSLKISRTQAILYDDKRENYLCKHLNIKYRSLGVEGYIDIQKFKKCAKKIPKEWWNGRRVYLAIDLSMTNDNTSVCMATADEEGKIYYEVMGFLPKERVDQKSFKEKFDYHASAKAGECIPCGNEVIDYGEVERYILNLRKEYGVEIIQCGYDRYNALSTVQKLEANDIECVEIRQHSSVLHPPTKLLKEKVLEQQAFYNTNSLLENNMMNARCTEDTNRNKYVNKKRSGGKVDMVVTMIMCTYLIEQELLNGEACAVQVC